MMIFLFFLGNCCSYLYFLFTYNQRKGTEDKEREGESIIKYNGQLNAIKTLFLKYKFINLP